MLDQNATYTLDAIDAGHNGGDCVSAWFNFDTVRIPGTLEPSIEPQVELAIQPWAGGQVRISWPLAATGYTLQSSATVAGGYASSGLTVAVEGDRNVAYAPASANAQFYRLIK